MLRPILLAACALGLAAIALATPLACPSPCGVASNAVTGYIPAVAEVASGGTIVWSATDVQHVQVDHGPAFRDACLVTLASPFNGPDAARFEIVDGRLFATTASLGTLECVNAQPLPAGGFGLAYSCTLHATMRGTILVTPA